MERLITKNRWQKIKAFSLIETMLALFIFSIFSIGIVVLSFDVLQRDTKNEVRNDALLYAQEGLEATRNMRDRNFLSLVTGDYGLTLTSDTWSFVAAPETIDAYYARTITVADVYRDVNGAIAESGTLDPNIKKITSTVTWNWKEVQAQTLSLVTYLSNWTGDEWMQTTCDEFDGGTYTQTESEAAASPPADNCSLELELVEGQSSFFESVDVGDHGTDVVVDGNYAYLTTGKSNEGLVIIDISDPSDPEEVEDFDIGGKGRYLVKSGDILYIGVESSSKGLAIVDVSDPDDPELIEQMNLGGYGNQPVVSGTTLFMGVEKTSNSFVAYDVSDPSNPSSLGSYNTGSATKVIELNGGSNAFVGISNSTSGLRILNISNPASITQTASLNVGEKVLALDYLSSVLYTGIDNADASLKVVNVSNPVSPSVVGTVDVNAKIQDLAVESNYLYATLDDTNFGLVVLNIVSPLNPQISFFADIDGKGTGIDTTTGNVFIALNVNNQGLVLVETVNVEVADSGTFVSDPLDTGSADARFNFIEWVATVPPTGSVSFEIRTADTETNLASATWMGAHTVSPSLITTDPVASGTRFVQFQVTLTSDGVSTPSIDSVSINFNP